MATKISTEEKVSAYKEQTFNAQDTYNKVDYGSVVKLEPIPVYHRFMDLIKGYTTTVILDRKYHYKPEFLSQDLYDSDEYWSLLLELNGCQSRAEFTSKEVTIITVNQILTVRDILKLAKTKYNRPTYVVEDLTIKNPGDR